MNGTLRVILEVGKKRRVVAGATDWPGLDRWGTSEDDAVTKLRSSSGQVRRMPRASQSRTAHRARIQLRITGWAHVRTS